MLEAVRKNMSTIIHHEKLFTVLMVWLMELPYSLTVPLLRSVKVLHLMSHLVYC